MAYDRNKSSPRITSNLCFYVDYHTIWPPRVIVSHYLQIILRLFGVDIDEKGGLRIFPNKRIVSRYIL